MAEFQKHDGHMEQGGGKEGSGTDNASDKLRGEWLGNALANAAEGPGPCILDTAKQSLGLELWRRDMTYGALGGAASVARVLENAGIEGLGNPLSVDQLSKNLQAAHWSKDYDLSHKEPGDIQVSQNSAHSRGSAWIVGKDGSGFMNLSATQKWAEVKNPRIPFEDNYILHAPKDK